jgi:hypothetical protein
MNFTQYNRNSQKLDLVNDPVKCNNGIMLEPRLREYLIKKKYYKNNNIRTDVSLEQTFQISRTDKKKLKQYLIGKKNIHDYENKSLSYKYRKSRNRDHKTNNYLANDLECRRLKKKIKDEVNKQYPDKNNFNKSHFDKETTKFAPRADPFIDPVDISDNKYFERKTTNLFHMEDDNYGGNFITQNEDIYKIRSMPQTTKKSYGYRNPAEHYFQYLDPDIFNPSNTVEPWKRGGVSTRLNNKTSGKNAQSITRDIY